MESIIKIGLIMLIVFGSIGLNNYWQHRRKMEAIRARADTGEAKQLNLEVEALKQRVATLEKIVTDKGYQLHEEFEKLKRDSA